MSNSGRDNPALAKAEPVARLGPSGFDPARWAVVPVSNGELQRGWQVWRDGEPISGLFDKQVDAACACQEFIADAREKAGIEAPTLYSALQYARNLIGPDEIIDAALAAAGVAPKADTHA